METLVTQTQFAQMAGVSRQAVGNLRVGVLAAAMVGKNINTSHPDAVDYLEKQQRKRTRKASRASKTKEVKSTRKAAKKPRKAAPKKSAEDKEAQQHKPPPKAIDYLPPDIRQHMDLPFRQIIEMYGTDHRFNTWMKGAVQIEQIAERRVKNAKALGELVSRELVIRGFLSPIEEFHTRLLNDGAKSIAKRCEAKVKAGATSVELERFVREQIEQFIKPMKAKIKRSLRECSGECSDA